MTGVSVSGDTSFCWCDWVQSAWCITCKWRIQ